VTGCDGNNGDKPAKNDPLDGPGMLSKGLLVKKRCSRRQRTQAPAVISAIWGIDVGILIKGGVEVFKMRREEEERDPDDDTSNAGTHQVFIVESKGLRVSNINGSGWMEMRTNAVSPQAATAHLGLNTIRVVDGVLGDVRRSKYIERSWNRLSSDGADCPILALVEKPE
jgi:hypothetical protein